MTALLDATDMFSGAQNSSITNYDAPPDWLGCRDFAGRGALSWWEQLLLRWEKVARVDIISLYSWTISDGGKDCSLLDFVITVKTNNPGSSTDLEFTIPTYWETGYNFNVDCNNDGTDEATAQTGDYTCNYGSIGTYTIRIKDNQVQGPASPGSISITAATKHKLLTIEQWGTGKWTSMESAFYGCENMTGQSPRMPGPLTGDQYGPICSDFAPLLTGYQRLGHQSSVTNMSKACS